MPSKKKSMSGSGSVSGNTSQQVDDTCKLMPKKRGRRPKDKSYTVISNYKETPVEVEDENIILHLPGDDKINSENYNDIIINTDGIMRYDPILNEPIPYEPLNQMQSDYANILEKNQGKIEVDDIENRDIDCDETSSSIQKDEVYVRTIGFEEMNKNYFNVLKKVKILKMMQADDNKKEWETCSDIACFYCTEKFQTMPIGIPLRHIRGKYYCKDNFCSFNCAAAYIFSGFDTRYHFKKWEYYSLLCLLAKEINEKIDAENGNIKKKIIYVKLAEDRNLLKKFGGPMTIDEFRKQFYFLDKKYSLLYPPVSCMYPQTEVAHYVSIHRQKAMLLNNENRFHELNDLRLKRDKPLLQKKNTLEEYMSLKIS
jgi:hypothetical protein